MQSKIAIYDEKIKTAKENIEANRKQLKQMDEAVDQIMGRSTDEKGADKANAVRKSQQRDRTALAKDIEANQRLIASLNDEAAPIRAEVRKVEAEVGPIKYIAQFVYGETNEGLLEKAVTWVIIILIVVFDPMAVILLLASQISFQNFRERKQDYPEDIMSMPFVADVGEEPTAEETTEGDSPEKESDVVSTATVTSILAQHPYLLEPFVSFKDLQPMVYKAEGNSPEKESDVVSTATVTTTPDMERPGDYLDEPLFVQNEEQKESDLWTSTLISKEEYLAASANANLDPYNDAPHPDVAEYIALVKSGKITLHDIPEEYMLAVKARM